MWLFFFLLFVCAVLQVTCLKEIDNLAMMGLKITCSLMSFLNTMLILTDYFILGETLREISTISSAVANPSSPHRQSQSNTQRAAFTSQRRRAVGYKWEEKEKPSEWLWHSLAPPCMFFSPFLPPRISPSIYISDGLFGKAVQARQLFARRSPFRLKTSESLNDRWGLEKPEDNRKLSHLKRDSFFLVEIFPTEKLWNGVIDIEVRLIASI